MGDKVVNLLHGGKDPTKIKWLWNCKVEVSQGAKRKHQPMQMRDGYIIKVKGMAIYSSWDGERINRIKLSFDHLLVQASRIYQLCDRMAQQWHGWRCQGRRRRVEGGNLPQACPSSSAPPMDEGSTPLSFNWGVQYMAENPIRVEAIIVVKEVELIHEYETHQGRPLATSSF